MGATSTISAPMISRPLRPSSIERSSRVDHPPTSAVPVAIALYQLLSTNLTHPMKDAVTNGSITLELKEVLDETYLVQKLGQVRQRQRTHKLVCLRRVL